VARWQQSFWKQGAMIPSSIPARGVSLFLEKVLKLIKDTPEGIDHITHYSTNELNHCISARGDKIDKQRANDKIYVPLTVLETN